MCEVCNNVFLVSNSTFLEGLEKNIVNEIKVLYKVFTSTYINNRVKMCVCVLQYNNICDVMLLSSSQSHAQSIVCVV